MEYLDLVKRAKSGNEEAFIRLMELQSDCMYKMAKTILKNEEDVADAMAETVLVCWEKLSTLKESDGDVDALITETDRICEQYYNQ